MHSLHPDTSYHIFNHANGFENVFREPENYRFFLEKYHLYISPVAETYAWCLMPNHFHLVVRIRKRRQLEELIRLKKLSTFSKVQNFGKGKNRIIDESKIRDNEIEKYLSKQFANLFSCYTQSFNKANGRMGSLFVKNFKREPINSREHFLHAVIYTHRNPIHHRFRDCYDDWPYSSYFGILNGDEPGIETRKLLKLFGGKDAFKQLHHNSLQNMISIDIT
ncbi:transposase [Gaoshiqia sp. Z1-71]|uniref:transposase n=1 Tax=Gaoshiqia hydrogeniformans TaxID=3290090 RepID=UPI003BF82B08